MKLSPDRLIPVKHACYYLFGEDRDALFESAEALLACPEGGAQTIRADISEIERIELESKHQGLFGATRCHALIRNAESANPKQTNQLLQLIEYLPAETRLVICAAGIESRKALHKKVLARTEVASCQFARPTSAEFQSWLHGQLGQSGLRLSDEAEIMLGERLDGMRQATHQAVDRLRLYDGGRGEAIGMDVVGDLLGERSPAELADFCQAVTSRKDSAISILHRLLTDQQVAEVQVLSWLQTRFQSMLLYLWHAGENPRDAAFRAKLFGDMRRQIPQECKHWQPAELMRALGLIAEAEVKLKGASVENKAVVIERLTLDLLKAA